MRAILVVIGLFLCTNYVIAAPRQLFREVNPQKANRLEEFNSEFLREELYFSKRHRIIKVNPKVLDKDENITLTPFDDMAPLLIVPARRLGGELMTVRREWGAIFWEGRIDNEPDTITFGITLFDYDSDPDGVLSLSMQNQFRHSQEWEIDDSGRAFLPSIEGGSFLVGPPPTSEKDLEHHRKMKNLKRKTTQALLANFWVKYPDTGVYAEYRIEPLRFTPKYSVIYEVDQHQLIPMRYDADYDREGNEIELQLTKAEKERKRKYDAFKKTLINQDDRPVMEDIE